MRSDQRSLIPTWAATNNGHGRAAFFHEPYPTTLPHPLRRMTRRAGTLPCRRFPFITIGDRMILVTRQRSANISALAYEGASQPMQEV